MSWMGRGFAAAAIFAMLPLSQVTLAGTKIVNGTEVRDWEAIDTNKDGSISPEEIEKFLSKLRAKKK